MKMSLNTLLVLLVPLALAVGRKFSSAETSATSATRATITASSSSATDGEASEREHDICAPCAAPALTCAECAPGDGDCATSCRLKCLCGCTWSYDEPGGMDVDLWRKCDQLRGCGSLDCEHGCSMDEAAKDPEGCSIVCYVGPTRCRCECMQLTRARARVAITAATTCSLAEEVLKEREWLEYECEFEKVETFMEECDVGRGDVGSFCWEMRILSCLCGFAELPAGSQKERDLRNDCNAECHRKRSSCTVHAFGTAERWCEVYEAKCKCACGHRSTGTSPAEYRTAAEDRVQLELCAYAWSCDVQTCGCDGGDRECLAKCRDSCRCGCLDFPEASPGVAPASGWWSTGQCEDKRNACSMLCSFGDDECQHACYMDREKCKCKCVKWSVYQPEIVQHCNFIC